MKNRRIPGNEKKSLRMRVYDYITSEMDKGRFSPGSFIRLRDISEKMGVSKTPLREAMIKLESEGFVTIYPRQGVVVNEFDLPDSRFLFEAIGAMECALISSIFEDFTTDVISQMRELCSSMRAAIEADDYRAYEKPHWQYHDIFLELSGNIFAERMITPIKFRLWDCPKRGFSKKWIIMACDEHEKIVDSIEKADLKETLFYVRDRHWSFAYNEKFIRQVYFPDQ